MHSILFRKKMKINFSLCEAENEIFFREKEKKVKKSFDFQTLFNINLTTASAVEP